MSWRIITDDWRLKLLAIALAVLMLGAVAFSQNPPTSGSLSVGLTYANIPPNLILINPPPKTTVTYSGVADAVAKVSANCACITATVDVSHARPGSNVTLNVVAHSTFTDVTPQNPPPINVVTIDQYVQNKDLQVQVSAHAAPGWSITKAAAQCPNTPCVVHFSGPASWLKNMTATVSYPSAVNLGSIDSPNQPILLTNSNGLVDLSTCQHTDPCATLDTLSASIHIEAVPGLNSSAIVLIDPPPSHPPANGYRITAVTITPNQVVITGDPTAIGKIRNIVLPAVDLSGKTNDYTATVNIPYENYPGITGSVGTATIKYSISPNPAVSPSP
jgi:hypothetical protein